MFVSRQTRLASINVSGEIKSCRYCQQPAQLLRLGDVGYPYQRDYGPMYVCVADQAWVGVHRGTTKPLGGLANAELREWKMKAHAAFDPLWQAKIRRDGCSKSHARKAGYRWLSEQLGIPPKLTHIGYMSVEECRRVVEACEAVRRKV